MSDEGLSLEIVAYKAIHRAYRAVAVIVELPFRSPVDEKERTRSHFSYERCEDDFPDGRADVSRGTFFDRATVKPDVTLIPAQVFETGVNFRYGITRVVELCNDNDSAYRLDLCTICSLRVHRETLSSSQFPVPIHFDCF